MKHADSTVQYNTCTDLECLGTVQYNAQIWNVLVLYSTTLAQTWNVSGLSTLAQTWNVLVLCSITLAQTWNVSVLYNTCTDLECVSTVQYNTCTDLECVGSIQYNTCTDLECVSTV